MWKCFHLKLQGWSTSNQSIVSILLSSLFNSEMGKDPVLYSKNKNMKLRNLISLLAIMMAVTTSQGVMAQDAKLLKNAEKGKLEAMKTLVSNYWNGTDGFEKNAEQAKFCKFSCSPDGSRAENLRGQKLFSVGTSSAPTIFSSATYTPPPAD